MGNHAHKRNKWTPFIFLFVAIFCMSFIQAEINDNQPDYLNIEAIKQLRDSQAISSARIQLGQKTERMRQNARAVQKLDRPVTDRHRLVPRMKSPFGKFEGNRSSNFYQSDRIVLNRLLSTVIDIKLNAADVDTITQGDDIVITVDFSDGYYEADIYMWLDINGNNVLDYDVDLEVDEPHHIADNDPEDEDPTTGIYKTTLHADGEGPNMVSNITMFFEAVDQGGIDVATEYVAAIESLHSVSGTVSPVFQNIIVTAFELDSMMMLNEDMMNVWMTVTDVSGNYEIFLPDLGNYVIMAFDYLEVTGGMYPDTAYFDVFVNGHMTGFNFEFFMPNSAIEGFVVDETGMDLEYVYVWVDEDWEGGMGRNTETDSTGYYFIGVNEGDYRLGIDSWDLIPDYLVPIDTMVYVGDFDTVEVNFVAQSTDSYISGTVYLNDVPYENALVSGGSHLGWTESHSSSDGYYELSVSSAADAMEGYWIGIHDYEYLPPGTIQINHPGPVMSGATDVDIYLATFSGGIEGHVYNNQGEPIWAWINAHNGFEGFGTGTDDNGYFNLPLPNGNWEIMAGSEGFSTVYDSIVVLNGLVSRDYWLQPLMIDATISGTVYEDGTTNTIEGVQVVIGNDFYWDETYTDMYGNYHFDVPYGIYGGYAWKEGYAEAYPDSHLVVNLDRPDLVHDYYLHPFTVNAAIEGVVLNGDTRTPVGGATVYLNGEYLWFDHMTGPDGYFHFDVSSGNYSLDAWAPGFHHSDNYDVFVPVDSTAWVEIEVWPQMVQAPELFMVHDVPDDQGRQVRLAWHPGNPPDDNSWTRFSIWRQVDGMLWDFVASVPYHGMEDYSIVVPTLVDSNHVTGPTNSYWSTFIVSAHTWDPWDFYDSNEMSGYSKDNLMPHTPMGLAANGNDEVGGIELTWQPVPDTDFEYFTVYRGLSGGITLQEAFAHTVDTSFVDASAVEGETYYYLVTSTDHNGNESAASAEVSLAFLSVDSEALPDRYELAQNYPNPFNPSTMIEYALPEAGYVTVKVYNILGAEVATIANQFSEAGRFQAVWNGRELASGVYLVQMKSADFVQTRKIMLMK